MALSYCCGLCLGSVVYVARASSPARKRQLGSIVAPIRVKGRGQGPRATLAHLVADADCPLRQDLRAQAAPMSEAADDLTSGHPLQVIAGLAQTNAANFHDTNLELSPHKMIERHTTRDHVASRLARSKFEVVLALEGFDGFGLDQRKLTIGQGFRKGSQTQSIAVAFQPNSGNGASLVHRVSRCGSGGGDVDEIRRFRCSWDSSNTVATGVLRAPSRGRDALRDSRKDAGAAWASDRLRVLGGECEALVEHVYGDVSFVLGDDQGRRDAYCARTATQEQNAAFEGQLNDAVALLSR